MGLNAQTTVPTFVAAQVLTADQQNQSARTGVPVFATTVTRDAAFGGAGEKTLAAGQLCYLESTNKLQYNDGTNWANIGGVNNVTAFTASGTFTPPAGVTYAVAYILAGGGGTGRSSSAGGTGGTSSVAFAAGTISATGGLGFQAGGVSTETGTNIAGTVNSGQGGRLSAITSSGTAEQTSTTAWGQDGACIVAGGVVTPAVGITVTVGAGGTAGTGGSAGGSGYVWIEYQV